VLGLECRAATKVPCQIVGCAAVFDSVSQDLEGFREVIDRRAFGPILGQEDVRAPVNHEPTQLIGGPKRELSTCGNSRSASKSRSTCPTCGPVATSIRRGDMDGMSFSYDVGDHTWDRGAVPPVLRIQRVKKLYSVRPVTYEACARPRLPCDRSSDRGTRKAEIGEGGPTS
jgi:phage head maturation protease